MDKNILCIEDNVDFSFFLSKAFESINCNEVTFLDNGGEAMDMINEINYTKQKPTLILLDLNLPDIHGLEILKTIRQSAKLTAVPVVILSSSSLESDINKAYKLGANCFVTKPPGFREIKNMLSHLCQFFTSNNAAI